MVRSRSMRLLLRQPKRTGVLESNSPLMPAMLLLLSPHILLSQYPVSILRTTKTVFPQHALVVSDTYFELSQAYEAHERACHGNIPTCVVSQRACN